jgi:hypothetical protein
VSTQVKDLVTKSRDKRSYNFIFSMLKRYHYLVNPSCAMAAQGMKTLGYDFPSVAHHHHRKRAGRMAKAEK